jgi:hypothetical protein
LGDGESFDRHEGAGRCAIFCLIAPALFTITAAVSFPHFAAGLLVNASVPQAFAIAAALVVVATVSVIAIAITAALFTVAAAVPLALLSKPVLIHTGITEVPAITTIPFRLFQKALSCGLRLGVTGDNPGPRVTEADREDKCNRCYT